MFITATVVGVATIVIFIYGFRHLNNRSLEQADRKLLASFPERNPHPILMLSAEGKILYANPSALNHVQGLDLEEKRLEILLPNDINARIERLRLSEQTGDTWEYCVGDRTLECNAYFLPENNRFHLCIFDITERKKAEQNLIYYAYHDVLTELPNRRSLQKQLDESIRSASRTHSRYALMLLGIDRFKAVTGNFGHDIGDALLCEVSVRISQSLDKFMGEGERISMFRFDGDIFALLIKGYSSPDTLEKLANSVVEDMRGPLYRDTREFILSLSCGISQYPIDGHDTVTLLRNADIAMYQAKRLGGDSIKFYCANMKADTVEWYSLENYLRHALEHDELCLHYQPQIDIKTEKIVGVEALLRWYHPDHGLLTPDVFIPLAEKSGIVNQISEWILRTVCTQNKKWQAAGLGDITVAINISVRQFLQPNLCKMVESVLNETGLSPHLLEMEITENVAIQDLAQTQSILNQLKELGIRISIDDFGTGYSSLSYIKHFPVDKIKVDQVFIKDLASDPYDSAIIRAIITLGHSLALTVVAEGVETQEQFNWLKDEGCDQVQGYIVSKPVARDELEPLLVNNCKEQLDLTQISSA